MPGRVSLTNNNTNNNGGTMILNHQTANMCSLSTLLTNFTEVTVLLQKVASNVSIFSVELISIPTSSSAPYFPARPSPVVQVRT